MTSVFLFEVYQNCLKFFSWCFFCLQMLVYMVYFVPFYACAIHGLLNPGQTWLPDWALLYAGAAAQVGKQRNMLNPPL